MGMDRPDMPASPPGLFRRLGALLYDCMLLSGILFLATAILMPLRGKEAFTPHQLEAYRVYLLAVIFLFFGWFWTQGGQTLGMRAWKIKLCSSCGGKVTWKQAGLRFFAACFSLAMAGAGFFWIVIDKQKRAWHDIISHTRMENVDF